MAPRIGHRLRVCFAMCHSADPQADRYACAKYHDHGFCRQSRAREGRVDPMIPPDTIPIVIWMTVCLRMFLVLNAAFFINSYAHMVGDNAFNRNESARDHWLGALITNGEGYHSFHHRYPNDYRNGIRWYHWDPSKWFIYLLSRLGFAWDLKRSSM